MECARFEEFSLKHLCCEKIVVKIIKTKNEQWVDFSQVAIRIWIVANEYHIKAWKRFQTPKHCIHTQLS